MQLEINKRLIIALLGIGILGFGYNAYDNYKRQERVQCVRWLLREENRDTILPPEHTCYDEQVDTREFVNGYQPEHRKRQLF